MGYVSFSRQLISANHLLHPYGSDLRGQSLTDTQKLASVALAALAASAVALLPLVAGATLLKVGLATAAALALNHVATAHFKTQNIRSLLDQAYYFVHGWEVVKNSELAQHEVDKIRSMNDIRAFLISSRAPYLDEDQRKTAQDTLCKIELDDSLTASLLRFGKKISQAFSCFPEKILAVYQAVVKTSIDERLYLSEMYRLLYSQPCYKEVDDAVNSLKTQKTHFGFCAALLIECHKSKPWLNVGLFSQYLRTMSVPESLIQESGHLGKINIDNAIALVHLHQNGRLFSDLKAIETAQDPLGKACEITGCDRAAVVAQFPSFEWKEIQCGSTFYITVETVHPLEKQAGE